MVLRPLAPPLSRTLALVRRGDKKVGPAMAYVEAALMTLRETPIRLPRSSPPSRRRPRAAVPARTPR